jgi:glycosyltransferase involved in cell wall biosynthesis
MAESKRFACVVAAHDLRVSDPVEGHRQPANVFSTLARSADCEIFATEANVEGPTTASINGAVETGKRVFSIRPAFDAILTSGEDVGLPVARYGLEHYPDIPVNIITHGSLFWWSDHFKLIKNLTNVKFLCVSNAIRMQLISRLDIPPERAVNVGYYTDTEFFRPKVFVSTSPTIVGGGLENRDYESLVKATADLDVQVRIAAGSVWRPNSLHHSSETVGGKITIQTFRNRMHVRDLYAESAFVVVPLHASPTACGITVVAEAMAMAKAVITTYTEGRCDFLVDGATGFFYSPGNVDDLRCKILTLLEDPHLTCRMGKLARRMIETSFSVEQYCERIVRSIDSSNTVRSLATTAILSM